MMIFFNSQKTQAVTFAESSHPWQRHRHQVAASLQQPEQLADLLHPDQGPASGTWSGQVSWDLCWKQNQWSHFLNYSVFQSFSQLYINRTEFTGKNRCMLNSCSDCVTSYSGSWKYFFLGTIKLLNSQLTTWTATLYTLPYQKHFTWVWQQVSLKTEPFTELRKKCQLSHQGLQQWVMHFAQTLLS